MTAAIPLTRRSVLIAGGASLIGVPAIAQAWPSQNVRIIVPFAAGGPTDVAARLVANALQARGVTTIVENRAGAGVLIGTQAMLQAPRDGYTFLLTTIAHAAMPAIVARIPFDLRRDFTAVALVGIVPLVALTNKDFPGDLSAFLDRARARPGDLLYGSAGIGSAQHLASELLKAMARVDIRHVPYRGAGPAVTDLMAGSIQLVFDGLSSATPQIRAGTVKALAVSTAERVPSLPDLPTVAETVRGYEAYTFNMLLAGAGTPALAIAAMNEAVNATLRDAQLAATFGELGIRAPRPEANSPAEAERFLAAELDKWPALLAAAGVRPE